jgi:ATP-dependent Lon protease
MTKEAATKIANKTKKNANKRATELAHKRKQYEPSSSSCSSSSSSCSSSDYDEEEEEDEEFDIHEYRKLVSKIFPSKHMNKKIEATEKLKNTCIKPSKTSSKKSCPTHSHKKKSLKKEDTEDEDQDSNSEYNSDKNSNNNSDSDSGSELEDDLSKGKNHKSSKINIVFTIGNAGEDDELWETDEDDSDYEYASDGESEDEDEDDEDEDEDEDDDDDEYAEDFEQDEDTTSASSNNSASNKVLKAKTKTNARTSRSKNEVNADQPTTKKVLISTADELKETETVLASLKVMKEGQQNNAAINSCIKTCEETIAKIKKQNLKQDKKRKDKNCRIFKKQLREKNTTNDFDFFSKLDIAPQKKIIKELREINALTRVEKPYKLTLLESNIPNEFKAAAMKRINSLKYMERGSGEFYKIKNWVDTFMKIPFGKYETLPVNIADGVDTCHDFMSSALQKLDDAVYGLNDAKMQIMQMLGQLITNPQSIGSSIALKGPMGTGKTSIVKEGISKILNRPFAFIALGGATDSSFLEGHSYTYEGSTWGKIVQIIIDSKCMNPVIYFDELDKISDTPKGEEIAGILTHLTDSTQNSQFHDKYFTEVDFDLSKCLFIFSYNDESKINPILRDRMYKIHTKGYDKKQKTIIANKHLLPRIREQVKFNEGDIVILEDALHYIIDNHCAKEEGVRNLKRCLEIIYTKLNLYRLMKPETNLFEQEITLKVEFPFTVTKAIVDKLIKPNSEPETWRNLYN